MLSALLRYALSWVALLSICGVSLSISVFICCHKVVAVSGSKLGSRVELLVCLENKTRTFKKKVETAQNKVATPL